MYSKYKQGHMFRIEYFFDMFLAICKMSPAIGDKGSYADVC